MRDHRVRTGMVDTPITGVAAIGLGVWLLAPGREAANAAQLEAGLELLALAKGISARQDFPSLSWQLALDEAERDHPELDITGTMAGADVLPRPQRIERLNEVLRSLRSLVL
jgi:hypothetical protein